MLTCIPIGQHAYVGSFGRTYLELVCAQCTNATTDPRESPTIIPERKTGSYIVASC